MSKEENNGFPAWVCDICGKKTDQPLTGAGWMAVYGVPVAMCEECNRETLRRIRKRYMIVGEHTEPAE